MEEPHLFSFRWIPYGIDIECDPETETPTLVEFRLTPDGAGTRLTIVESGFEQAVYRLAHNHSIFYGSFAVFLAIITGWLGRIIFRKD